MHCIRRPSDFRCPSLRASPRLLLALSSLRLWARRCLPPPSVLAVHAHRSTSALQSSPLRNVTLAGAGGAGPAEPPSAPRRHEQRRRRWITSTPTPTPTGSPPAAILSSSIDDGRQKQRKRKRRPDDRLRAKSIRPSICWRRCSHPRW